MSTVEVPVQMNMAAYCLEASARLSGEKAALVVLDQAGGGKPEVWSYRQLEDAVLGVAAALNASGLQRGERVLIRLDNTSAYAVFFFGAIAAGLVPIPASAMLTDQEARFLTDDSGAAAVALADRHARMVLPGKVRAITAGEVATMMRSNPRGGYAETLANDPAFLIYTSGTTARPKGVLHAHRSAPGRRPMYQGWYGIGASDRMLHAGGFNWTFTLGTGLTDPWANGATAIVFTGEKSPEIWPELIRSTRATLFAGVPGVFRQILKYAPAGHLDLADLRHGLTAGETPPPSLFDDWRARTGTALYEALGMSEISTYISSSPTVPRKAGTTGKAQAGRRIAILPSDGGETPLPHGHAGLLAVHRCDPGLMLGYWQRPTEEQEVLRGEWFVGGDLATIDAEGYVTHLGRGNEIMNAMGYRVSPLEVEGVLAGHPDVAEVACAEISVRQNVSVIAAFIVPAPGAAPQVQAIRDFAGERLAAYKCPREILFVASLPRTANGKVQRARLALPGA